jgi:rod shape-determining protein MreD
VTDAATIAGLLFVAALLQATLFSSLDLLGGTPDVLLLVLIGIALLRGSVTGAVAGFGGGLLLDVLTLDTLGLTSLLLALAGYWTGRYGETTGRNRAHAPVVSVVVVTSLVLVLGFVLHFLVGDEVSARRALLDATIAGVGLNLIIAAPVLALCRAVLPPLDVGSRAGEVRVVG